MEYKEYHPLRLWVESRAASPVKKAITPCSEHGIQNYQAFDLPIRGTCDESNITMHWKAGMLRPFALGHRRWNKHMKGMWEKDRGVEVKNLSTGKKEGREKRQRPHCNEYKKGNRIS